MKHEYSVQIAWSKEDLAYLAVVPELPGCIADGHTPEEALANIKEIVAQWIQVATEEKRKIPRPMSVENHEAEGMKARQALQAHIQKCVEQAVAGVLSHFGNAQQQEWPGGLVKSSRPWHSTIAVEDNE